MNSTIGKAICQPCGRNVGRSPADFQSIITFTTGRCDYCGLDKGPVTDPRNYGYPLLPMATAERGKR